MDIDSKNPFSLGLYSSVAVAVLTVITFVVSVLTPPLSGPLCASNCFVYPFTDIASRFPRDYYWMFLAIPMIVAALVWITSLHFYAKPDKKIYSQLGMLFAWAAGIILITDYFVQLSVIQPSLLKGETDGISILSQFNSHGVFIALEDLGYLLMAIGFTFLAPAFTGNKLNNAIRWTFFSSFILTMLALAWFTFQYGVNREYRFEIASLSIVWLTFIVSGAMTAIEFKRGLRSSNTP